VSERQAPAHRRQYLDWLRGIGVLIMIEGHALDSWTRLEDRTRDGYERAILIAGFGAPLFLFLAGVALALAAGSRVRKGWTRGRIADAALRRGAWIFGLAFLFRLQSWIISGGAFPGSLLKVDILNVMGLSMVAAAAAWPLGRTPLSRAVIYSVLTAVFAMLTPIVRATPWLSALPDPIEAYLRPAPGSSSFTLFPWTGFLTGGAALGTWLDLLRSPSSERRGVAAITAIGAAVALAGYTASFLPALYANSNFWTSSPTFFFLRLGVVIASIGLGYTALRLGHQGPLLEFGRASLFVYWIHVEMVYGVLTTPLHRRLPLELAMAGLVLFGLVLFGLVRLKDRLAGPRPSAPRNSDESPLRPAESHVP
jgi:uncharacterized membrane protein